MDYTAEDLSALDEQACVRDLGHEMLSILRAIAANERVMTDELSAITASRIRRVLKQADAEIARR